LCDAFILLLFSVPSRASLRLAGPARFYPGIVLPLSLYTIWLLPILYGVKHTAGGSRGGRILPNSRAIVLRQCGQCRWAGRMKERLVRARKPQSNRIYAWRMCQPTQRATNYTARSNLEPAQIFLHANGQSAPRSGALATSAQARGATHRARPISPS